MVSESCRVLFYLGLTGLIGFSVYNLLSFGLPFSKISKNFEILPKITFTNQKEWIALKLSKIEDYNHNCKIFRFNLPSENHITGLKVTSALMVKIEVPSGDPISRAYTPISMENTRGHLDLLIKRYENGIMSTYINNMKINETLLFRGPIIKYPWSRNMHSQIALIAGGTGITPMYQLIRKIFNDNEEKTDVTLIFANISEEDILLRKELEEFKKKHPDRFHITYVLDNPSENWNGVSGRVNKELLKTLLPPPSLENIKIFVCGPSGFYKVVSGEKISAENQGELCGFLKELGYTKEQVYKF